MTGLLDLINDPDFHRMIEERRQLIQRLADWASCPYANAERWLDDQDSAAVAWFAIGNDVPRESLH